MKASDLLRMIGTALFQAITKIPLILIGLIIVPIALIFRYEDTVTRIKFTEWDTHLDWTLVTLPKWAWLWSNDRDGAIGDKRGWWNHHCPNEDARDFSSMFTWLAIRNPVHNSAFTDTFSCDISKCYVAYLGGENANDYKDITNGWQLIKATNVDDNKQYYHFYYTSDKWFIRIGHKFKRGHNKVRYEDGDTKKWKKYTFRIRRVK